MQMGRNRVGRTKPALPEPRPTEKARATRAALISSAAEAFVDDGYGATSVRDLADRSELTSGAIYGHFKSKANLLGEAVRFRIDHDLDEAGRREYGSLPLADYLERNFRDYERRQALRALIVEAAAAGRVDPDVRKLVHDVIVEKQKEWNAIYEGLWQSEHLDPEIDPSTVQMVLFATELGFGVLEALEVDLPKPNALGRLVGRFIGSLRPTRRKR
jgi:AcrR family transcriptional regulator